MMIFFVAYSYSGVSRQRIEEMNGTNILSVNMADAESGSALAQNQMTSLESTCVTVCFQNIFPCFFFEADYEID
jgi:hypothetical protein